MDFNVAGAYDSFKDGTKELAELTHVKTNEFHKNYVSKFLPDCGKYGDKARFIVEMVPGVTEYNAIRDGNWKDFAIAAGLDVASLGIGAVTAGAGYAAIKGGEVAAKEGTKLAVKEIAEAGMKKVVGETAESVTKRIVKESGEIIERTTLEVGDKIDKTKIPKYLEEIEQITNRKITEQQKKLLKNALKENDYAKLSKEARKIASREFNRSKLDLINKWEKMTGQDWPCYAEDVINGAGKVLRKAGQPFDVHHIIELSTGGPNEWWNLHPARFPDEHQGGIHAVGSLARLIFG